MTHFRDLSGSQKGRILSFIAIAAVLLGLILLCADTVTEQTPAATSPSSCYIDGSDFTPVANFCVAGFNGFILLLAMLILVGIVWITSTVSLLAWRFIAIQKRSVITELEWKIAKITWFVFITVSLIGCLIILHFSHLTFCTFLTALPILLLWLLGVLPLQKRYRNWKDTSTEP